MLACEMWDVALQTHTTDTFLFISHTTNVFLFKFHCNIFIGVRIINPLNAELNPICHLLALLGAHHILNFSRVRIKEIPVSVASGTLCSMYGNEGKCSYIQNSSRCINKSHRLKELVK